MMNKKKMKKQKKSKWKFKRRLREKHEKYLAINQEKGRRGRDESKTREDKETKIYQVKVKKYTYTVYVCMYIALCRYASMYESDVYMHTGKWRICMYIRKKKWAYIPKEVQQI